MKVLYVHGYNSNANSTTSKLIRELSDFEVHTITYNPEHPIEAIKDIRNYCKKYKIASPVYFSKNRSSKDGLYSICKDCRNKK